MFARDRGTHSTHMRTNWHWTWIFSFYYCYYFCVFFFRFGFFPCRRFVRGICKKKNLSYFSPCCSRTASSNRVYHGDSWFNRSTKWLLFIPNLQRVIDQQIQFFSFAISNSFYPSKKERFFSECIFVSFCKDEKKPQKQSIRILIKFTFRWKRIRFQSILGSNVCVVIGH